MVSANMSLSNSTVAKMIAAEIPGSQAVRTSASLRGWCETSHVGKGAPRAPCARVLVSRPRLRAAGDHIGGAAGQGWHDRRRREPFRRNPRLLPGTCLTRPRMRDPARSFPLVNPHAADTCRQSCTRGSGRRRRCRCARAAHARARGLRGHTDAHPWQEPDVPTNRTHKGQPLNLQVSFNIKRVQSIDELAFSCETRLRLSNASAGRWTLGPESLRASLRLCAHVQCMSGRNNRDW